MRTRRMCRDCPRHVLGHSSRLGTRRRQALHHAKDDGLVPPSRTSRRLGRRRGCRRGESLGDEVVRRRDKWTSSAMERPRVVQSAVLGHSAVGREAWQEIASSASVIAMLLPANRTEQPWWQELVESRRDEKAGLVELGDIAAAHLDTHFLPGRIKFGHPGNKEAVGVGSPPFGCVLLVWSRVR